MLNKCLFILLLVFSLLVSTAGANPIIIQFRLSQSGEEINATAAAYLKKLIEQRSSQRIQVSIAQILPPSDTQQTIENLRSDRYQLALIDSASLADNESALSLFDQPFLFDDVVHLHRFLDSPAGAKLLDDLSQNGIVALSLWDQGFRQLIADSPLLTPGDVAGKVLGIRNHTASSKGLENLGAEVLLLDPLHEGGDRLDGAELTLTQIEQSQLLPANLTLSDHAVETILLLSNQSFWSSLSEEMKVILQGAIQDAALYTRELATQVRQTSLDRLAKIKPMSIYLLTKAQRQAWRNALLVGKTKESDAIVRLRQPRLESKP